MSDGRILSSLSDDLIKEDKSRREFGEESDGVQDTTSENETYPSETGEKLSTKIDRSERDHGIQDSLEARSVKTRIHSSFGKDFDEDGNQIVQLANLSPDSSLHDRVEVSLLCSDVDEMTQDLLDPLLVFSLLFSRSVSEHDQIR